MAVDPKNLDLARYAMVDPAQTDPEQYATGEDDDPPAGAFPYGVATNDGRMLWGVVPREYVRMLLLRERFGGCYQFWALDGPEPPQSGHLLAMEEHTDRDEPAGWRDAYVVEFDTEQEP